MSTRILILATVALIGLNSVAYADGAFTPGEPVQWDFENFAQGFLDQYCLDCHDEDTSKGNFSLEDVGSEKEAVGRDQKQDKTSETKR